MYNDYNITDLLNENALLKDRLRKTENELLKVTEELREIDRAHAVSRAVGLANENASLKELILDLFKQASYRE